MLRRRVLKKLPKHIKRPRSDSLSRMISFLRKRNRDLTGSNRINNIGFQVTSWT
jgi:hypothetical protein